MPPTQSPAEMPPTRRRSGFSRKQMLVVLGIATVIFDIVLVVIDRRLTATGGPSIIGLEFAGSQDRVTEIASEWGNHGQYLAKLSLWLDFGFMLVYGAFFTLSALATRDFAREHNLRLLARAGIVTPFFAAFAAIFDAAENVSWLLALGGHGGTFLPPFATTCASIKFLLISLAIAYVLWGLASRFLHRREPLET